MVEVLGIDDLTVDRVRRAKVVRVTDGTISSVVWTNRACPDDAELYVAVDEITYAAVDPVRRRIAALLIGQEGSAQA